MPRNPAQPGYFANYGLSREDDEKLWFSIFLENALVGRVNRRMFIRIVRFCRST